MYVKMVWLLVAGSGKMDIGRSVWSKLKEKKNQNKKVIRKHNGWGKKNYMLNLVTAANENNLSILLSAIQIDALVVADSVGPSSQMTILFAYLRTASGTTLNFVSFWRNLFLESMEGKEIIDVELPTFFLRKQKGQGKEGPKLKKKKGGAKG